MAAKHEREIVAVRLQNATLDDKGDGTIVAHGWLDLAALLELRVGDYQREILEHANKQKSSIYAAVENHTRLPDIMLGMRGEKFTTRGQMFYLEDDVYIIDGLQRVSALRKYAVNNPDDIASIRIGAEVRFSTTRESEKELFTLLNVRRTAMSPNIILRNAREESNGLLTLYGLTHNDPSFALYGRVCWNQRMSRNELMTASSYCKVALHLSRGIASVGPTTSVTLIPPLLARVADEVGIQVLRDNIYRFYEVIDEIWGIKGVKYVDLTTHLRANFLNMIAKVFTLHENFWDKNRLVIDAKQRLKLKAFPLTDPTIQKLSAGGGAAADLLYRLMVDHMNKGQKINRLIERSDLPSVRAAGRKEGMARRRGAIRENGKFVKKSKAA
jgi:hypothetical protein